MIDMKIFELRLPRILVVEGGLRELVIDTDVSILHDIPEEDLSWTHAAECLNSPC